ncbi:MAG: hypothetical protein V3T21_02030 [Candidatus Margulisiibacteriota bacterium]
MSGEQLSQALGSAKIALAEVMEHKLDQVFDNMVEAMGTDEEGASDAGSVNENGLEIEHFGDASNNPIDESKIDEEGIWSCVNGRTINVGDSVGMVVIGENNRMIDAMGNNLATTVEKENAQAAKLVRAYKA